ncbi:MAG: RNA-directed DNA polymerase [Desulfobacterales bacterium]|nr:RNA-directed DNA polymerase [Desulfobacterales bacterium]
MISSLLGSMSADLLIPKDRLDYLLRSAPYRYKVYQIPKRSGSGTRTIAQPAKEVKSLQYWVIKNIYPFFPIHPSATAYTIGKSILKNSEAHATKPYLLKLDFKDFFPSITGNDFLQYSKNIKQLALSDRDLRLLMRLLFWLSERNYDFRLSIGAPTSPFLSNAIMYQFDQVVFDYCNERNISYTRYADDMAFSMHNIKMRSEVLEMVQNTLTSLPFPKLQLNHKKTIFGSKAHRRIVTGLVLSNNDTVSLGREKKRRIRAQIHHLLLGRLDNKEISKLKGMLAFAHDIEPAFVERMVEKYGEKVIKSLRSA